MNDSAVFSVGIRAAQMKKNTRQAHQAPPSVYGGRSVARILPNADTLPGTEPIMLTYRDAVLSDTSWYELVLRCCTLHELRYE